jgi:hypothetical protein
VKALKRARVAAAFHLWWRWTRYCFACDRIYLWPRAHRKHGCMVIQLPVKDIR